MTLPGPNGGSLHFGANCAVPNSGPQDPGLHSNSQDPGPSFHPQHHVSARPFFYIHPPPPPPFLQYQWPMPFSYNPFAGYPGMGYGMVMPSFPPPPYMDPSAYLLPQPHIQAVDYRRLLHPQVHAPSAPFHNPNQTRRTRPPHTVQYRETMNSEVQTEPTHREAGGYGGGSPLASSDSGNGTTSNSPSSSSSPLKRDPASVENHNLPSSNAEDFQLNKASKSITVKHGSNIPHPTKTVHSCIRETQETQKSCTDTICQETVPPCRSAHCNMWSVSSSDSMVPLCSSSQEENEVAKERRVSIPDILMSWGGGTPQSKVIKMTDKMLPHCNHQVSSQTELEHERPLHRSPTVTQDAPVMTDSTHGNDAVGILSSKASETFFKILKLPKISDEQEDGNETNLEEDTPEVSHNEMPFNSYRMRRKMNESVWSVESLPLFAPSKEWLLQNGMLEPDVIVEMTEEAENCEQSGESDDLIVQAGKMKQHCRTPPKVPELDYEMYASEMKGPTQGQCITPENVPLISMTGLQNKIKSPLTAKDVDENGSSEPEANRSPNQEPLIVNGQKERSPCPLALEAVLLLNPTVRKEISFADHPIVQNVVDIEVEDETRGNEEVSRLRNEQLSVPVAKPIMTEVSPSKGHLVDCGIQCTELQEQCPCRGVMDDMETKRHRLKYSDVKMANNGQDEGFGGHVQRNQKRHYQRRNKVSEEYGRQQEAFSGYYGKSGKSRGGNGRNTRC
ncbi:uncharacterized protein LOC118117373 [Hippoglossus stenolepis]|uniref:uncharacterized protein LOC118117373 n=1 Tax=Hippoglossus stenolepis TaxID=195615 RepID=UPI001FAFAF9F|nr:uncharacterized protein LOC118117373 [Hippoglossus stenolepis]